MKKLPIDIGEIASMMEMADFESNGYLDTQTGKTVLLPPELVDLEFQDDDELDDLPEWEKELVPIARAIEEGSERYVLIPDFPSYEAYELMAEFAESLTDPQLCDRMAIALDGKGAFRRFRGVLERYPEEEKRWYAFKEAAMVERVRQWLEELGLEPVEKNAESKNNK
ncbi:MAG: hypothetical protein KAY37_01175 [Phycisphaerae bacterium]|nr:hypothetical protein [Phycisphaerae bacterium]